MNTFYKPCILLGLCLFICSCSDQTGAGSGNEDNKDTLETTTESTSANTDSYNDGFDKTPYMELDQDMYMEEYQGQKVWIRGKMTKQPMQHMMKDAPPFGEPEDNITIDFNDGEQTVVYFTGIEVPEDENEHIYYGSIDKISGAGKDGQTHTEYFLMLDHVE